MYACDNSFIWLAGISIISLFENNQDIEELEVYLLGEKVSEENKSELMSIGNKYDREIKVIDISELDIPSSLVSVRWPLSAFTRLFLGDILPKDINRILYLDSDTIIMGSLSEIDNIEFNGNIVMGVKDCISGEYRKNIGLDKNSTYINSGVVLFDVAALRKFIVNEKIDNYLNTYKNYINYPDQDIINGMFNGYIGELSPQYNVMTLVTAYQYREILQLRRPTNFYTEKELAVAVKKPLIIHYATNMKIVRPWFSNTNHPYKSEFKKYLLMSAWKDKKLSKKIFDSKEERIISLITLLPHFVSYRILGVIHAELKPRYIRLKARKKMRLLGQKVQ